MEYLESILAVQATLLLAEQGALAELALAALLQAHRLVKGKSAQNCDHVAAAIIDLAFLLIGQKFATKPVPDL